MGMTFVINSLEEMCDAMCDNIVPEEKDVASESNLWYYNNTSQDRREKMGASKKIKMVMVDKGIKAQQIADGIGAKTQYIYNALHRDNMTYQKVEMIADVLGCEIVFRDKESGKIYY